MSHVSVGLIAPGRHGLKCQPRPINDRSSSIPHATLTVRSDVIRRYDLVPCEQARQEKLLRPLTNLIIGGVGSSIPTRPVCRNEDEVPLTGRIGEEPIPAGNGDPPPRPNRPEPATSVVSRNPP
uniref:Uncharacterized protein n=1 Tax=Musa acuminata TaxID=4641 RepID=Q1ENU8_MUSAC|nr:hypothetical protein MA4_82I11.38 [Musa acuminata]